MPKGNVTYTKDNEYYTPSSVIDYFKNIYGEFDYDPATTKEKAQEFNLVKFDTIETNGLNQDWTKYKRIWINPPFTDKHLFIRKAVETYREVKNDIFILVPIEFLTTNRFYSLAQSFKLFIPSGRVKFESGLGKDSKSPAFGSVILKLEDENSVEYLDKSLLF